MTARKTKPPAKKRADDFESVAKRLGCDAGLKAFDKKLGKIGRTKPKGEKTK